MPDTKTSAEVAAVALTGTEIFPGVQSAADVKITVAQMATYAAANLTSLFNPQTGISYVIVTSDGTKELTFSNAAPIAVSLPQSGTAGFASGWFVDIKALGAAAVTITPTVSTINGLSALVLNMGMWARVWSDGVNYQTIIVDPSGVGVNAQTGTSYTYVGSDRGKLITHSNAAAIAGTLAQATGTFGANWYMWVQNKGGGALTLTPSVSTIDGVSTLTLNAGQGALIVSDGANYFSVRGGSATGGGLTNFTESVTTAAPNSSVPVVALLANNTATSVDIALTPKGLGALTSQVADGTTTGGNKRGPYSVDWQTYRGASTNVASATYSAIGGGGNNTVSANYGVVPGGNGNTVSAVGGFAVGQFSISSGTSSAAIGAGATASGITSFAHGTSTQASGDYSEAGGNNSDTRSLLGAYAYSAGSSGSAGGSQYIRFHQFVVTTTATATATSADGNAPVAATAMVLSDYSVYAFQILVSAYAFTGTLAASFEIKGSIKRNSGAASTVILGAVMATALGADTGATAWSATAVANTTLGSLQINVTGAASTTINWSAITNCAQVKI